MNVEKLKPKILHILQSSDLDTITSKSVRRMLQQGTSQSLDAYRKELNALIMHCLDIVNDPSPVRHHRPSINNGISRPVAPKPEAPSSTATPSIDQTHRRHLSPSSHSAGNVKKRKSEMLHSTDENDTRLDLVKRKKGTAKLITAQQAATTTTTTVTKATTVTTTLPRNPFTKPWLLSRTLSEVTGETTLSRPGVVKALWRYIKAHQLQDPTNKQFIVCDDKLRRVFDGRDRMNCFTMNKLIERHLTDLPADDELDGYTNV